ncbi:MAG: hypothetical protein IT204_18945 [Fimbriimonadaceae bacterium]|nr:hypothetical protein [Fimbriimonadaceae bacterium]
MLAWTLATSLLAAPPAAELNLDLAAPLRTWDEAIPLGQGLLGGLLWGEGTTLRLSLDRGDLWDLRTPELATTPEFSYAHLRELVAAANHAAIVRIFDGLYRGPYPTKIGAGRLEMELPAGHELQRCGLDLAQAEGRAELAGGGTVRVIYCADPAVALLWLPVAPTAVRLRAPAAVEQLGYPAATLGGGLAAGEAWYLQPTAGELRYTALARWRAVDGGTLLAVTVATSSTRQDPRELARQAVDRALAQGWARLEAAHRAWWARFWAASSVTLPDPWIAQQYALVQYFYGAASRVGAPPIPLQGVWTADAGSLPPWKGDYHHDLNTQMTYAAYLPAGRYDEGRAFLEYLWDLLPRFREFARCFYGTPGAAVPAVMAVDGQPLGGWAMYSLAPSNAAWLAWLFVEHWRYTRDPQFLRERAWPWAREIGEQLAALLQPGADGVLRLPLSSSPEIHDNSLRAWLQPNSNYDLMCLEALFRGLAELAGVLELPAEVARWRTLATGLGPYLTSPDGALMFSAGEPVEASHRHFSHSMALHPFGLLHAASPTAARTIAATVARYEQHGSSAWCGYSFSWMAALRARLGQGEAAYEQLDTFVKAFCLRNGFHVNGDQSGLGLSNFTYRPVTLEGNFLAAQAVHEMLLQSWSADPGLATPLLRLFPAMPWRWDRASFSDLRAEGGHRVSATWEQHAVTSVRIVAGSAGLLRLLDPSAGRPPTWHGPQPQRVGLPPEFHVKQAAAGEDPEFHVKQAAAWEWLVQPGDVLAASWPAPATPQPRPAGAAEPLQLASGPIRLNRLPLRIGADSQGHSQFHGDLVHPAVYDRALSAAEVAQLASAAAPAGLPGCLVAPTPQATAGGYLNAAVADLLVRRQGTVVTAPDERFGQVFRLDGTGFLEVAADRRLDCRQGLTLAVWIRPRALPPAGARLLDKSPVGGATAYLLDTYPGDSLRLIVRDPHVGFPAKLPLQTWSHVAATVDGSGQAVLYVNGQARPPR